MRASAGVFAFLFWQSEKGSFLQKERASAAYPCSVRCAWAFCVSYSALQPDPERICNLILNGSANWFRTDLLADPEGSASWSSTDCKMVSNGSASWSWTDLQADLNWLQADPERICKLLLNWSASWSELTASWSWTDLQADFELIC